MVIRPSGNSWYAHAPAKLNLHLEILAKRTDGFHDIETLMLPLALYDSLQFSSCSTGMLHVECRWATGLAARYGNSLGDLPAPENNLITRALAQFRGAAGVTEGARVSVVKRIPSQAGLGGASSDAAAALLLANAAWGVDWSVEHLTEFAATLGSDIPFFFQSRAAVCRGRGERIEALGSVPPLAVVVVRPPQGLSTPAVYKACRVATEPRLCGAISAALRQGDSAAVGRLLVNGLQEPAEALSTAVVQLRDAFRRTDCLGHQMSGSGSSYFGICRNLAHARQIAARLEGARFAGEQLGLVAWGVAGGAA